MGDAEVLKGKEFYFILHNPQSLTKKYMFYEAIKLKKEISLSTLPKAKMVANRAGAASKEGRFADATELEKIFLSAFPKDEKIANRAGATSKESQLDAKKKSIKEEGFLS